MRQPGMPAVVVVRPYYKTTIANRLPYSLYGDIAGDYRGSSFTMGDYSLKVTPYSENCLAGTQGASMTITFELNHGIIRRVSQD